MRIISMNATEAGGYQIQFGENGIPKGYALVPDDMDLSDYYAFNGYIIPDFELVSSTEDFPEHYTMNSYSGNQPALDNWNLQHPAPDFVEVARSQKAAEISAACKAAIESGQDITLSDGNNYHFDYTIEDQSNIAGMWNAVTAGATCYPYHAKGGNCTVYSAADIITIYITLAGLQTAQTTYHNQLKAMLMKLETAEEIEAVTYGQPLEGEYLATYNEMIRVAQEQMENILKQLSAQEDSSNA